MKRVLLGTTALVAAGLLVTSVAYADEHEMAEEEMMEPAGPVTVGLSGYTMAAMGFASDNSDTMRGHGMFHVYEFVVSGSSTLDNGVTVGVHAQLGSSGDGSFDEQHVTLSGAFGSLRAGRTESAAYNATIGAPGAGIVFGFGVNYSWFSAAAKGVNTYSGIGAEDAVKVVYTSPNFNGLTLGVSYAPEDSEGDGAAGRTISTDDLNAIGAHTAVGLTYSTEFMEGGSLTLGAAYEMADSESGGDDPNATKFGVNIGIDQISFGGGMYDHNANGVQYDVGASWTDGPLNVGIQYAANENGAIGMAVPASHTHDSSGAIVDVPGTPAPTGETSMTALHLNYTLGPGVTIGAQVAGGTIEDSDDVVQVMLGTAVFF